MEQYVSLFNMIIPNFRISSLLSRVKNWEKVRIDVNSYRYTTACFSIPIALNIDAHLLYCRLCFNDCSLGGSYCPLFTIITSLNVYYYLETYFFNALELSHMLNCRNKTKTLSNILEQNVIRITCWTLSDDAKTIFRTCEMLFS